MIHTTRVHRHLKYIFSDPEILKLAKHQADCAFSRDQLQGEFDSIKNDYKGRIGVLETDIDKAQRKIRDGYEMKEIECEVRFHWPAKGLKTVVRLDTREVVAEERMLPHECQEILPFAGAADEDEDQGETIPAGTETKEGFEETAKAETETPAAEPERVWPKANENGVFELGEDADSAMQVLEWISRSGKLFIRIYALELADGWIEALHYDFGDQSGSQPLTESSKRFPTSDAAIFAAVDELERSLWRYLQGNAKQSHRSQLAPLSKLVDRWMSEYASPASFNDYPKPNEDLVYPEDKVQILRKDLGEGDYFQVKLLEVDEGVYQSNHEYVIGKFSRTQQAITDAEEAESRGTCIAVEIHTALGDLSRLVATKSTTRAEVAKLEKAIDAIAGYRDLLAAKKE